MAEQDEWLELLEKEAVETFNGRRTERTRIELFAADLSDKKLAGVDLSNANLEKSDLTGTDLTDANLMKANLAGIDGSGAILRDALALRCRFKDAWMDDTELRDGDFTEADFADANLERSAGQGARFLKARLRGANLTGAVWADADLSGARMHQAILVDTDLRNADLTEVFLGEADLTRAKLDGVRGSGLKAPQSKLIDARLCGAILHNASLTGADLTGADLSAADLSRANLSGANLTNAVLRGAVLADANLDGADLTGAHLAEADLSGLDPSTLGLSNEIVETLSGFGVAFDEDAELVFSEISVARQGEVCAVVWPNPEGEPPPPEDTDAEEPAEPEEPRTWRYLITRGAEHHSGVLPVPGHTVLDAQVVAFGDGFRVILTRSRPEGAVLMVMPLSLGGALGAARSVPVGYEPIVRPVIRTEGQALRMYGLARTGPTLVVHDLTDEPRVVGSDRTPTARGFLQGHLVLACKGGVVVPVGPKGPAAPRRTPESFPGRTAVALHFGDDLLAVWAVDRVGRTPGGVRWSVIGRRHAPQEEVLDQRSGVVSVQALAAHAKPTKYPDDDPIWAARVFWLQADDKGGAMRVWTAELPGGEPDGLDVPPDIVELAVAPGVLGLVRAGGGVLLVDPGSRKVIGSAP
ncbi:MAG: pentapeptide repeat-containing protein [Alphaproteobacteria bacterium]|nr:pentapeptide repeat-containing protein [Alphaproteobacteria bacterium]MCB9698203.1 pentapeptide repeat-containing protein [Alphaproteobacteria bacterium]